HRGKRLLVAPHGVRDGAAIGGDAEVACVAFVGTMRTVIRSHQRAHVGIATRNVEHRLVARFRQSESVRRIRYDATRMGYAYTRAVLADGNRMTGTGEFHVCRRLVHG